MSISDWRDTYGGSLGLRYDWPKKVTMGGAVVFADLGDADIDTDFFGGSYKENRAVFLAANLSYRI